MEDQRSNNDTSREDNESEASSDSGDEVTDLRMFELMSESEKMEPYIRSRNRSKKGLKNRKSLSEPEVQVLYIHCTECTPLFTIFRNSFNMQ